jgi:Na+-transporting NADH:ubiquinone oxidoreductase subunit F
MTTTIFLAVIVFTCVIIVLVAILNFANAKLVSQGEVDIDINDGSKVHKTTAGKTLLSTLHEAGVFLPAACGGGGSCGLCKCKIHEGGGDVLPTEEGFLSRAERKAGVRLGCQVKVKNSMKVEVPESVFGVREFSVKVISNEKVSAFMTDLVLEMPDDFTFIPGQYIQIRIPAYGPMPLKNLDIPAEYKSTWDRYKTWDLVASNSEETQRGYSIASSPHEKGMVMIRVRLATPPDNPPGLPPGVGSSYIFSLKAGDEVAVSGPYGEEFQLKDTDREACFIASGAGLGPMRGHIYYLFFAKQTKRKVTFWYGARSKTECCWVDKFPVIEQQFPNFKFNYTLSRPRPEDEWTGLVGHVHKAAYNSYLKDHPEPGDIEYYLCGPPTMMASTLEMLDSLGVEKEMIAFDEF